MLRASPSSSSDASATKEEENPKNFLESIGEFVEALEIIGGPELDEDDAPEAKALLAQIDQVEELRVQLEEVTSRRAYLRERAEGKLGYESNKIIFLAWEYWTMRVGRVLSKKVVRQGFANLFSVANIAFVIIFLRIVVPRLIAVQSLDDLFLVANELGVPTRANLEAALSSFNEYDFLFKLGVYQLAFILEKVTLVSELLPIQIGLKTIAPLLFGGLLPGALISATCETIGASVNFFLGRQFLTGGLRTFSIFGGEPLGEQKWFGSLNRVAGEDGFQLVLLLRLAHVLPLPFDSYWFIFGALPVEFASFFAAHWLGCLKTAFLDASLGELLLTTVAIDGESKQQFIAIETGGLAVVALAVSSIATGLANRLLALEDQEEEKSEKETHQHQEEGPRDSSSQQPGTGVQDAGASASATEQAAKPTKGQKPAASLESDPADVLQK